MTEATARDLAQQCAMALLERDNASRALGLHLLDADAGYAQLTMTVRPDMLQGHRTCHGGFIFALADSAFAVACNSYDLATVAQGCSIEYIGAVPVGDVLTATCHELSRRGRTGTYDVRIENQNGQLIALFRGKSYQVRGSVLTPENPHD